MAKTNTINKLTNWLKGPIKIKYLNTKLKLILTILIIVCAGLGGWLFWQNRPGGLLASALITSFQAEQMTIPTGVFIITDSLASGGQAIMLSAPGDVSGTFDLPSSATSFSIVAKGGASCTSSKGRNRTKSVQTVTVLIDGVKVLTTMVASTNWTVYSGNVNLSATSHQITVTYTNSMTNCAKKLYLDVINFYGDTVPTVTPPPAVALSASPITVTAGLTSTLTWSSKNATSCAPSGAWSWSDTMSISGGSVSTGVLNVPSTYSLSCTGPGGTTSVSTTVTVTSKNTTPPSTMGRFGYSTHIARMGDKAAYTDFASKSNAKTIRDDFAWSTIESTHGKYNWSSSDNVMIYASQRNMDVLAMAGYTPGWARDPVCSSSGDKCQPSTAYESAYATFVKNIAERYGQNGAFWTANPALTYHSIIAIEIWNEPNITFWLPSPNPARYTALLKAGYNAIKAVNPQIQVISAGLSPYGAYGNTMSSRMNPLNFLEQMYVAGAGGYMDAVGFHPYNYAAGRTADGMFAYHVASAWSQLEQTSPSIRSLMIKYGDASKKIWATEIGAPTSDGITTPDEQASFASKSVAYWKGYNWAGNYYWYDLREDCTDTTNTECGYGAISYYNVSKPSYTALTNSFK